MYKKLVLLSCLFLLNACFAASKEGQVNTHNVDGDANIAIKGYDPVAYFTKSEPTLGSEKFEYKWSGAKWRFSSQENKEMFKNSPEKYAPQYGGFCAYGVAVTQKKIDIEPEAWNITDGKLYLNYTPQTQNVWLKSKDDYIEEANLIWPTIKNN